MNVCLWLIACVLSVSSASLMAEDKPVAAVLSAPEKVLHQFIKEAEAEQKPQQLKQKQEILDEAVSDFIVRDKDGKEVVCSKENTIASEVDGEVRYRCRSESQALGEDKDSKRGEGETNQLIDDLMNTSNQSDEKTLSLSEDELQNLDQIKKQQQADIDNTAQEKSELDQDSTPAVDTQGESSDVIIPQIPDKGLDGVDIKVNLPEPEPPIEEKDAADVAVEIEDIKDAGFVQKSGDFFKTLPVKAYLSLRANAHVSKSENASVTDGGTRGGLIYAKRLDNDDQLILHLEVGSEVFGNIDGFIHPDERDDEANAFNRRLSYLRYGRDDYYVVLGKNWSVYHFIASMTDRFITVGGKATGIYNASTDGGATGSGRADNALQIRSSRGNLQWGLQI
ncbi:MAG: hypothetical protein HRU20_09530, partial [Pseudomonadales bacterium]|nr:hypothetical protein [Pseudomonadales bacterium]